MVYGLWRLGGRSSTLLWCMVYGAAAAYYGVWSMVYGLVSFKMAGLITTQISSTLQIFLDNPILPIFFVAVSHQTVILSVCRSG